MRITGHRTDSMERHYNIVDVEDIKEAKKLWRVQCLGRLTGVPQEGNKLVDSPGLL